MSYPHQPPRYSTVPSAFRQPSLGAPAPSYQQTQSPALVARINEKKEELEHLLQLKELSAALATQMEQLEQKLSTLADGTEAVAHVLANWQNILRAISMASTPLTKLAPSKPKETESDPLTEGGDAKKADGEEGKLPMPTTLVRIPTQHYQSVAPR